MCSSSANGGRDPIPPASNSSGSTVPDSEELLVIQAQTLLEDIEKTLRRDMRICRIAYGRHFPELDKIIKMSPLFFKVVKRIGKRKNVTTVELSDLLTPVQKFLVLKSANVSKGVDITDEEMRDIYGLCDHINLLMHHRAYLRDLLDKRMMNVAPHLTTLLGTELAAKMIVRAGSLMNLAKETKELSASTAKKSGTKGKTSSSRYAGECSKASAGTSGGGSGSSAKHGGKYGEGPSRDTGAKSKKNEARAKQADDGTDVEDSAKSADDAEDFSAKQISENEADDEGSESEAEEKPAKGALKAKKQQN